MGRQRDQGDRGVDDSRVGAGRRLQLGPDEVVLEDFETHRAILVGLALDNRLVPQGEESLVELEALAASAGADTVSSHLQVRESPDPATYVGSGKVSEIATEASAFDATLIVFDEELTPAQQRNLEKAFGGRRVLDRTQLILDLFAQNATTREGKVQVELAQLRYRLPRLRGRGAYLSRLGGGIGTRGPGETILEVDRRRIQERIARLSRELVALDKTRRTKRKGRRSAGFASISLVGYTNAGKSTLLNRVTDANVLVDNRLFSTLDTTVRRFELPSGQTAVLSDTVGFVRKLPHELVKAFHSTLEETAEADLLVHVVDASAAEPSDEIGVVRRVLNEVGAGDTPELVVWNKTDLVSSEVVTRLLGREQGSVAISAKQGNIDELLNVVLAALERGSRVVDLMIPYQSLSILQVLHSNGRVLEEDHREQGVFVKAKIGEEDLNRLSEFFVG